MDVFRKSNDKTKERINELNIIMNRRTLTKEESAEYNALNEFPNNQDLANLAFRENLGLKLFRNQEKVLKISRNIQMKVM